MESIKFYKPMLLAISFFCCAGMLHAQQLAFPTAEGYGKFATGGRGGKVIEVTNLNSSGPGSFAAAIGASGPRTVVFRVSGTITGNFSIKNDNITIAGQTAPGDGICIKGNLSTGADNIIIRYIRIRWDPAMGEKDAIGGRYQKNIIFDHVSASWSTDETMTLYHNENTTVQWCIIAQACPKGTSDAHRFGGIWGNNYGTWHHNLIAHNASRNPRWASGCGYNDYRNNVIYNWEYASSYGGEAHQKGDRRKPPIEHSTINMIANYYKPGPATDSKVRSRITAPSSRDGDADAGKWWVSDNFVEGSPSVTADNLKGVTKTSSAYRLSEPWPAMEINQQTAEEAFQSVLDHAGCSLPKRDKVDADIIDDVLHGTAKYGNKGIIDSPSDVGGWPELKSTPAPADGDHDGMPDEWEKAQGLDPGNPDDRNKVGADGYTMLEKYLNGIVKSGKKCMLIGAPDGAENAEFDKYIIPRLEAWGYIVDRRLSSELPGLTANDYAPYDFIFLSETTNSSRMSPLKNIPKPMVCSDGWAAKESALAFGIGEPCGILEPSQPIVFLDSAKDHPLAAGFTPGTVLDLATVEDEEQPALLVWGKPTIPVIAIAGVKSDPTKLAVYGIEKGTTNATGDKIPNRVVVIGPHAWGYDDLTTAGEELFKAAIVWVTGG